MRIMQDKLPSTQFGVCQIVNAHLILVLLLLILLLSFSLCLIYSGCHFHSRNIWQKQRPKESSFRKTRSGHWILSFWVIQQFGRDGTLRYVLPPDMGQPALLLCSVAFRH